MAGRNFLFVPGPTNVPDRVLRAMMVPMEDHRSPICPELTRACRTALKPIFKTATGVTSDVQAVRQAMDSVKHPALLFVDSVSALASIDFRMDDWRVDVCVSGSQKGLMLPAGLGVTCVSQKALEAAKTTTAKRCYFDYADMVQSNASGYFPYTPP